MNNLSDAEKEVIRDFKAFLIRNKLKFLRWEDDELRFVYISNGEETGGENNIFMSIQELVEAIGVEIV